MNLKLKYHTEKNPIVVTMNGLVVAQIMKTDSGFNLTTPDYMGSINKSYGGDNSAKNELAREIEKQCFIFLSGVTV